MNKTEFLKNHVEKLLSILEVDAIVDVTEEETAIYVNINGEDLGHLIGYHGENINALQNVFLAALIKEFNEPGNLYFDIEGYREKRDEKIKEIAKNAAEKVRQYGQSYRLNPMSASDRRLIHIEISTNYPDLVSYSVGEGRDRKVIIEKADLQ